MKDRRSQDVIINIEHNDRSMAKMVINGGLVSDEIIGDASTAKIVGSKQIVLITNTTTGVLYAQVGDASVSVPNSANAFPVLPNSQIVLNTDKYEYIRTSGAGLHVIKLAMDRVSE